MSGQTFTHYTTPQAEPLSLDELRRIIEEQRAPFEIKIGDERASLSFNLLDYEIAPASEFMPEGQVLLRHKQRGRLGFDFATMPPIVTREREPLAFIILDLVNNRIGFLDFGRGRDASGDQFERRFGLGVHERHTGAILRF